METINALAGPLGQRLTCTLLHFLWQGAVLAGLLESVIYLCGVRSLTARYRLALAALILMAACPIVTFRFVELEPLISDAPPQPAVEQAMPPDLPAAVPPIMLGRPELPDALPVAPLETPAVVEAAPSPPPRVSALARWQPWLLGCWAIGAGLLALRLLIGGGMAWRMRLARRPLDSEWADRARQLALRLGVRRAAVFVSARVRQALVAGVWRPMVLLPAAWLAEMPPEMLEGVLAHELAHLRRLDLWAILLQRLVETFLFYHPAVWWLSRRLSREREMCCDEMAVAATGDRLALTEALQWAVERPAAGVGPVLGAAWKGSQKMVIERIRRLLGADVPRERFSWWPLGLAALVVPALLMFSALSAKEASPAGKPGDGTPTLAEIAKANDAAWAAIRTVDMEMEMTVSLNVHGKTVREARLPGLREMELSCLRWSKGGARERVHGRLGGFELGPDDGNNIENNVDLDTNWIDQYYDGAKTYSWFSNDKRPNTVNECAIHPQRAWSPFLDVILLRYIMFQEKDRLRYSTLAQLIASGGVSIRGKQTSEDGDTIWVLEVDDPIRDDAEKKSPAFTRIYVNAEKGFLVSRVATHLSRTGAASRLLATAEHDFIEVAKFADCGHGVFFPSTIRCQSRMRVDRDRPLSDAYQTITTSATRLSVNTSLPSDTFGFRFPEHAVVYETVPGGSSRKVMIWGPDNKPIKEFKTEKDFDDFQYRESAEKARRQTAPRYDPKKPADSYHSVAGAYNSPQQPSVAAQGPQVADAEQYLNEPATPFYPLPTYGTAPTANTEPPGPDDTIVDVRIDGNRTVATHKIMGQIHTRAGRAYNAQSVQDDVRALTRMGLFVDVRPFVDRVQQNGVVVVFRFTERPLLQDVIIIGNDTYNTSVLKKEAEVKTGDAADPFAVENGRRKIEKYYQDHGNSKARVTILEGNKTGDLRVIYVVEEGPPRRVFLVNFVGNTFVSSERLKTLFSGECDRKKLDEDVSKLTAYYRGFGFFHARIGREVEFKEKQNCTTVTFVIDEGPRYSVRNVSFLGNRKLDNARLAAKLKLLSGQPFDQNQQTLDLLQLRDEYGSEGYVLAKVEADNRFLEEPGKLDIVYNIEEGARYHIGPTKIWNKDENPHAANESAPAAKAAKPARLPSPASAAAVVDVKISALEVDRAKCRTQGFDLDKVLASRDADNHEALVRTLT